MLFNSLDFALFLPIFFILYWFVTNKNLQLQNILIVIASYLFYGWWDWRFLLLIFFSTSIDFFVGLGLKKQSNLSKRKLLLWTSILVNLGFLGFFKYYNFFLDNFVQAFSFFGTEFRADSLQIILPVGISFYTFQTLSYTIDVYKRKLEPTSDAVSFFAYVSFFPQLVAGPIERASNLLPQFFTHRIFDYSNAMKGVQQIIWGLFKKMVIADNCAYVVNEIFSNYTNYSGSTLLVGAVLFAFQIYGDFSGYSDIAIGTARLFGFELKRNFAYPYFSRDIAEFWRRWHISLSTWFRDYVYIPLGGSQGSTWSKIRNVFLIFLISGFWHGANYTFLFWGLLNAIYFLPLLLRKKNRVHIDAIASNRMLPHFNDVFRILLTFSLVTIGWIFFRSESISDAFQYLTILFSASLFELPYAFGLGMERVIITFVFILILLFVEWIGRKKECPIWLEQNKPSFAQFTISYVLIIVLFLFSTTQQAFIYFQF